MLPRTSVQDRIIVFTAPTLIALGLLTGNKDLWTSGCILTGIEVLKLLLRYGKERLPVGAETLPDMMAADLEKSDWSREQIADFMRKAGLQE